METQTYQQMDLDEFTTAIRRLKDDELLTLKNYLEESVSSIKMQMRDTRANGRFDENWQARATRARSHLSRRVQAIQNEMRNRRVSRAKRLEQAFVTAARQHLTPDTFERLMNAARESM
ncbi:MAG: hypothetical protein IAE79_17600 [Anaerolinea sp.]|nr:hypothetical protein [Anaerolinea sp.]